jgi:hypothetical protein
MARGSVDPQGCRLRLADAMIADVAAWRLGDLL